jgi:hypothetical protein
VDTARSFQTDTSAKWLSRNLFGAGRKMQKFGVHLCKASDGKSNPLLRHLPRWMVLLPGTEDLGTEELNPH